jgi:hypothetical protein
MDVVFHKVTDLVFHKVAVILTDTVVDFFSYNNYACKFLYISI